MLLFSCISPWFSLHPSHIKKDPLSSSVTMLQILSSQAHTLCLLSKQGLYHDFGYEVPAYVKRKQVRFDLPKNCNMAKLEFSFMKIRKRISKMHCSKAQKYQIIIKKKKNKKNKTKPDTLSYCLFFPVRNFSLSLLLKYKVTISI